MRKFLPLVAAAALAFTASSASAVEVINQATQSGSLVTQNLAPGADLTNNGPFRSNATAYLFDEGINAATSNHTFLLHFDRSGGVFSAGRVRGSFDFTLDAGELFLDVFSDYSSLLASDDLSNGVLYQRADSGLAGLVTVVRGLEAPGFPFFGDILHITPNPSVNNGAPTYHVSYDFRNDGASLDEVRFVFSPTTAVPEPTTWALMIGGFGMMGAVLRRRRAAAFA